jgi:hypothetical protein
MSGWMISREIQQIRTTSNLVPPLVGSTSLVHDVPILVIHPFRKYPRTVTSNPMSKSVSPESCFGCVDLELGDTGLTHVSRGERTTGSYTPVSLPE